MNHIVVRQNVVQKIERWQEAVAALKETEDATASAYSIQPSAEQRAALDERIRLAGEAVRHHATILADAWDEYDLCAIADEKRQHVA